MKGFVAALALLITLPAAAQNISTDRPDFGVSTSVVPPMTFQVETGLKRLNRDTGDLDQFFETLLRFGLAEPVELRAGWAGIQRQKRTRDRTISGSGDLTFGAKLALSEGRGIVPAAAAALSMTLPSGDQAFSSGETVPQAILALAWPLNMDYSLTLNGGSYWIPGPDPLLGENDTRERADFYSATLSRSTVEGHTLYMEIFGIMEPGVETDPHSIGFGYLYLWRPTMQFDIQVGTALTRAAPDAFVGFGFSIRLPE